DGDGRGDVSFGGVLGEHHPVEGSRFDSPVAAGGADRADPSFVGPAPDRVDAYAGGSGRCGDGEPLGSVRVPHPLLRLLRDTQVYLGMGPDRGWVGASTRFR